MNLPHHPFARFELAQIDQGRRPSFPAEILIEAPAAQMMRARDHPRPDSFGDPYLIDEIADFSMHLEQIAGAHPQAARVLRMEPKRIAMGNFVQPLGIARSRMD